MTEPNHPETLRVAETAEQDPLKEAQPIADAGSLNIEAPQAPRRSAAESGEAARAGDAQLAEAPERSADAEPEPTLAPEDADRFAMAFRPSWEPLAPPTTQGAANFRLRSFGQSLAPAAPPAAQDASGLLQDDLLHLRAARVRVRSLALAAVSVLSFGALMYWGISSTTDSAERTTVRGLPPPPPAAPDKLEEVAAPAPTPAPEPNPEPTRLTARLADPTAPAAPVEPIVTEATEATEGEQAAGVEAQPAPTPEQTSASAAPAAPSPAPAAASPDAKPATITDVKPATVSVEAKAADTKPLTAAADAKPVEVAQTAKPPTAAAEPKPAQVAATTAVATKPAAASSEVAAPLQRAAAAPQGAAAPAAAAQNAASPASSGAAKQQAPLLVVRAVPDTAQLFLDGQRMSNPFDVRLPLGSKHKLDARQDGYETSSQTIRLESDAKLTITLNRVAPAPEPHLKVRPMPESANGAGFVTSNPY